MRSRGTPRIANRLLKRLRDYAQYYKKTSIDLEVARLGLKLMDIDNMGLDNIDRIILDTIIRKYNGGPVGLETLSASTGEEPNTIEDVVEPYLMQLGFIQRTPKGRIATKAAYEHMGIDYEKEV